MRSITTLTILLLSLTTLPSVAKTKAKWPWGQGDHGLKVKGKTYVIERSGSYEARLFELQGNKKKVVSIPKEVYPGGRYSGMTFDSKRRRLLVATTKGVGYLLAYDLVKKKWSELSTLGGNKVKWLHYNLKTDRLYTFAIPLGGEPLTLVHTYTADGKHVEYKKLEPAIELPLNPKLEVSSKGPRLKLDLYQDGKIRSYLLDPETGEIK